jgi:serine/threonine protein kinase
MTSVSESGAPEGCTPGQVIAGELVVRRELGRGGVGIVYLAEHRTLKAEVAVKILRPGHRKRAEVVDKFRAEGRALWELAHAGFVKVMHAGEDAVVGPYIVMEVLRGATVRELLNRFQFDVAEVVDIVIEVAEAAQAMHELGIIHRDLKPENLFLQSGPAERVKILDLGVAKIERYETAGTAEHRTMGTGRYMSPEHVRCEPLTPASDVYALSHIAFEMLTGEHPFEQTPRPPSDLEFQTFHLTKPTRRLVDVIPEEVELSGVIEQGMSSRVESRFQSMAAFGRALTEAARTRKIRLSRGATVKLRASDSTSPGEHPTIEQALADLLSTTGPPRKVSDAPDRPPALLVERNVDGSSMNHALRRGESVVGRLDSVDVQLRHPSVSGRHARLIVHASGIIELFDDGSGSGTTVNGKRVSYALLKHGDQVQFGAVGCELALVDPPEGPRAHPPRQRAPQPPVVPRAVDAAKNQPLERPSALGPSTVRMPAAPRRRRTTWVWALGIVMLLAAVAFGAYHTAVGLLP